MNIKDIVIKKNEKKELSYEEIKYFVDNYINGNINDEDMTLLLKSIMKNDMTEDETFNLTKVMIESGDVIDLSNIKGIKVDKHSTGGIGDKTTLVVGPLVASLGIKVCKMSGRSLGFTGGTIDKLESIKGFKTNLTMDEFIKQVNDISIAITSQTGNLVPADKKIYALRDVTNTTESIPLIASSIMSKKIASGSDKIVLDVKVGKGAFMKDIESAKKLANTMINIGKKFNKEVVAIITNMNYPLGFTIGNSLEVKEAIDTLDGLGEERFTNLCVILASYMVSIGKNISVEESFDLVVEKLNDKSALNKFKELISYQGGNIDDIKISKKKYPIISNKEGYLVDIDSLALAKYVNSLGAGRINKDDKINHEVGLLLNKKVNDYVQEGELLGYVYSNKEVDTSSLIDKFIISDKNIEEVKMILEVLK